MSEELPEEGTLLILDGMGVPLYSARGLTDNLTPIQAAFQARRSINGILNDTSRAQSRKYALKITCTDVRGFANDGIFPGAVVTVHPITRFTYPSGGSPNREVVSGSEIAEGHFISYRPVLHMMVVGQTPSIQTDEYAAKVSSEVDLEEIGDGH